MKSDAIFENPYQPPAEMNYVSPASEALEFSGEITKADYQRMLPTTTDIVLGRVVLVLGFAILLPLLVATGVMVFRGMPNSGLAVVLASLLVSFVIAGTIFLVSPSARARRYLRKNLDLLGPASGTLGEWGLVFDDGNCKHWFSWSSLPAVVPRSEGVRVSLDSTKPARFLALSSRIFVRYSRKHAERIVAEFGSRKRTAELQTGSGEVFGKSLTDDGFFSGVVSTLYSLKSTELWASVVSELIIGIGLIAYSFFVSGYWQLLAIVGIYGIVVSAQRYWLYLHGTKVKNHLAWGWIDPTGLIYALDSEATWRPRSEFSKIVLAEQHIEFYLVRGGSLYVYFKYMKNPTAFAELAKDWKLGEKSS